MTTRPKRSKATPPVEPVPPAEMPVNPLDQEPYRSMFAETAARIDRALAKYGEPTMSLEELRVALHEAMGVESFSDLLLEDRRSQL